MFRNEPNRYSGGVALKDPTCKYQKIQSSKIITFTFTKIKNNCQEKIKGDHDENELLAAKQATALNPLSRKISKSKEIVTDRRPLAEISNQIASAVGCSTLVRSHEQKPYGKDREFKEDSLIKPSSCPINLKYLHKRSRRTFSFKCYRDKDLKFPSDFANKTVDQSCDNDCSTDEDQILSGIRNLFRSLEGHVKLMRDNGKKPEDKPKAEWDNSN